VRVAIHQPNFLPRLKVLQKLAAADTWVVLDSVQYCDREWQNRARIVAMHGKCRSYWLSVPVHQPDGQQTLIRDITIVDPDSTARLIRRTLLHSFRRAPYWNVIDRFLASVDSQLAAESLTQLCVDTTSELLRMAGREPKLVLASSLSVTGNASVLMAAICRNLHADVYLADSGARTYLQVEDFDGIDVLWQDWAEPQERWNGIDDWRNVSSVNYLCRVGPERFKDHTLESRFAVPEALQVPYEDPTSEHRKAQ
jgi:hypothetical protein